MQPWKKPNATFYTSVANGAHHAEAFAQYLSSSIMKSTRIKMTRRSWRSSLYQLIRMKPILRTSIPDSPGLLWSGLLIETDSLINTTFVQFLLSWSWIRMAPWNPELEEMMCNGVEKLPKKSTQRGEKVKKMKMTKKKKTKETYVSLHTEDWSEKWYF